LFGHGVGYVEGEVVLQQPPAVLALADRHAAPPRPHRSDRIFSSATVPPPLRCTYHDSGVYFQPRPA
jgi:hypothetical protein